VARLLETGVSRGKIAWGDGRCSQRSASSILAPQRVPDREKMALRDGSPCPSPERPFMKIKSAVKAVWKPTFGNELHSNVFSECLFLQKNELRSNVMWLASVFKERSGP
jgi:hypothetical protein